MTDFCLDMEKMKYLCENSKLIWIDHHITAINSMQEANIKPYVQITSTKHAACGLTWLYFIPK